MKQNSPGETRRLIFTLMPIILLVGFFAYGAVTSPPARLSSLFLGAITLMLFIGLGVRFIPRWMEAWSGLPEADIHAGDGKRSNRRAVLHPVMGILLCLTAYRLLLFAAAYALHTAEYGYTGGLFDNMELWSPTSFDARHYLSIAEHWYQSAGEERFLLVFFPFYPVLVRMANFIFENYLISGLFVSNMAAIFSGFVFYELALLDMDKDTARRSLKYLCILPASFLFSAPLSDSLFFFFSVSCMYFARRKNYPAAGIAGFFCAFTRLLGVIMLAPVLFELIADLIRESRLPRRQREALLPKQIGNGLSLVLIPLGLCAYLFINEQVSGNPFQFLIYQRENWQQSPGWFFHTAQYQWDYLLAALESGHLSQALGLWLPNLIYLVGALGLLLAAAKRLRPAYVAYFIAYYLVSMGATWLLSAPRYLTALFPLSLALGTLTRRKVFDGLATLLCLAGLICYLYAFVMHWSVY